jgi:DNA-binding beta-propeller fold protein YncE
VLALAAAAGLLICAAVALASSGALTYKGCIANNGRNGCKAAKHNSLAGAISTAVSPDGKSVYVGSFESITRFKRGPGGALTYAGCIGNDRVDGCKDLGESPLGGVYAMAVSPDGRSLYALSAFGSAVMRFDRAPSGALTYRGCFSNSGKGDCRRAKHRSLGYGFSVGVSPDGKSVYVTSAAAGAVTRFKRGPHGALTYAGCVANRGARGCKPARHDSLDGAASVAVSPDGSAVYVGAEDGVTRFKREPHGVLKERECISGTGDGGCKRAAHDSLRDAYGIAVSPDGGSIYASSYEADAISRFKRRASGALSYRGCTADQGAHGCKKAPHRSLNGAVGVAVSGDGRSVYAAGYSADSITRLKCGPGGRLFYRGCIANRGARGCDKPKHDSLGAAVGLAISPDDRSIYVASLSGSITRFQHELAQP